MALALDEQVLKRRKRGFAGDISTMAGVQVPPPAPFKLKREIFGFVFCWSFMVPEGLALEPFSVVFSYEEFPVETVGWSEPLDSRSIRKPVPRMANVIAQSSVNPRQAM